jgi:cytochrome c oxidase subunit 2
MKFPLFPEQASTTAGRVDALYFALTGFSVVILLIVFLPMIYFLFKYRRSRNVNRSPARLPTMKMEITWTTALFFIGCGMFAWGAQVYFDLQSVPRDAMEINVIGKQWMWRIQHADGRRELNQLHVPVGRTVKLTLASEDVIHSFFLPAFRIKQDVVPGRYTSEWFTANKPGVYHLFCAEYCGTAHSRMIGQIIVMKPDEFQQWLTSGAPAETLAASGEKLFRELGCSGCHLGNSIVPAPRLEGLYGRLVPLQEGKFVRADEKYIRDSILLPQSQITAGYQPVMPTFQGRVTEEELLELVSYIKGLGQKPQEEFR